MIELPTMGTAASEGPQAEAAPSTTEGEIRESEMNMVEEAGPDRGLKKAPPM